MHRLLFAVALACLWATAHAQTVITPGKGGGAFDLSVNQTTPGPSQFAISTRGGFAGLIVEADTSVGSAGVRVERSCDGEHWSPVSPIGSVCVAVPTNCFEVSRFAYQDSNPMCVYRLLVVDPC